MKHILFLCTGNSARSIIAETYMNAKGAPGWRAFSGGSKPTGKPNPFAIEVLSKHAMPPHGARSKSWDEFTAPDAPQFDVVVTVCSNAANETCPLWPSRRGRAPRRLHWPFEDPAAVAGDDELKRAAFEKSYKEISARIDQFIADEDS
ncbi:MAG: arsenate reductase ArsC [Parvularculaceae bacterium]